MFFNEFGNLPDLSENQINEIPEWNWEFDITKSLIISKNQLTDFPLFGELQSLEELYLWANTFTTFPEIITQLQGLKRLDLSKNQIIDIPEGIGNLTALEWFRIAGNAIKNLSIQVKTDLQVLKTNGCDIIGIEPFVIKELNSVKNAADSESTDYHGIIIWQSQRKKSIFRKLNCIGSRKFFLGLIMIQKIQVSPEELEPIIAELQQNLTDRFLWMRNFYFHLYREDELIVVFRDQIFHLTADVENLERCNKIW